MNRNCLRFILLIKQISCGYSQIIVLINSCCRW